MGLYRYLPARASTFSSMFSVALSAITLEVGQRCSDPVPCASR